jgi:hypothetical protein
MRIVKSDGSEKGIYKTIGEAAEKIELWRTHDGIWWAVVRAPAPEGMPDGVQTVSAAYMFDGSETSDKAVKKWAEAAFARAQHPELETSE